MTGVFNVKKLAIWHATALTYSATNVITTHMLPWTAWIRYPHLACWHTAEVPPITGMIDPPLDIVATPDVLTMITEIDPGSVIPDPAHIHTGIEVAAVTTPIGVDPGHFTDLPDIVSHATEAYCHHCDTPHCRPSSHRNLSQDDSRSQHKSLKHHYKPAQGSLSSSQATPSKNKDKRQKQVTIDNPPSEYYSSDGHDSDSEDDLN